MARPPRYDSARFLDAALDLAAAAGPGAVTMQAVAKEVGAPSGSVYHRFPSRAALLGELWLRTVEDFQKGWLAAIGAGSEGAADHPRARGARAARHVVAWSRAHPREAAVLLYGPRDFAQGEWPEECVTRAEAGARLVRKAVAGLCEALGLTGRAEAERVALAVVDLPLTVVRRHLRRGHRLPAHAEALAADSAAMLLSGE